MRWSRTSTPNLPDEWEAFLADAALAGRIVYQVKQLSESLTGQVELEHLSENSFGSLLPARGYFYLKSLLDFLFAVALLPVAVPAMLLVGLVIRLDSAGPALFRQSRIGHAGRRDHHLQVPDHAHGRRSRGEREARRSPTTPTTASRASAGCCAHCGSMSCRRSSTS